MPRHPFQLSHGVRLFHKAHHHHILSLFTPSSRQLCSHRHKLPFFSLRPPVVFTALNASISVIVNEDSDFRFPTFVATCRVVELVCGVYWDALHRTRCTNVARTRTFYLPTAFSILRSVLRAGGGCEGARKRRLELQKRDAAVVLLLPLLRWPPVHANGPSGGGDQGEL